MPVHPRHAKRLPPELYDALMQDAARLDPLGIAQHAALYQPQRNHRGRASARTRDLRC